MGIERPSFKQIYSRITKYQQFIDFYSLEDKRYEYNEMVVLFNRFIYLSFMEELHITFDCTDEVLMMEFEKNHASLKPKSIKTLCYEQYIIQAAKCVAVKTLAN